MQLGNQNEFLFKYLGWLFVCNLYDYTGWKVAISIKYEFMNS